MKNDTIKMNMRSAVLYTESRINFGKKGFFVNTEFGRIGVEINPFADIDPLHPVTVLLWEQGPDTVWAVQNKNIDADYYLGINIFDGSDILNHMAVIEGISRVMLWNVGFEDPTENAVQALIQSFMANYDDTNVTINTVTSEYMFTYMNKIARICNSTQIVVREMFQQKFDSGRDIIEMGNELLSVYNSSSQVPADFFMDKYSEEVFGILLYCHMKQKKSLDGTLQNIVKFHDIPGEVPTSMMAVNN